MSICRETESGHTEYMGFKLLIAPLAEYFPAVYKLHSHIGADFETLLGVTVLLIVLLS